MSRLQPKSFAPLRPPGAQTVSADGPTKVTGAFIIPPRRLRGTPPINPMLAIMTWRKLPAPSLKIALVSLTADGRRSDGHQSRVELLPIDQQANGAGRRSTAATWGDNAKCTDYSPHSMQVGGLYYSAVVLGGSLAVSTRRQKTHRRARKNRNRPDRAGASRGDIRAARAQLPDKST